MSTRFPFFASEIAASVQRVPRSSSKEVLESCLKEDPNGIRKEW